MKRPIMIAALVALLASMLTPAFGLGSVDEKWIRLYNPVLNRFQTVAKGGLYYPTTCVTSTGLVAASKTVSTVALGTVRTIYGQATASATAIASGNVVGVRGLATLSGTITAGGAYIYGAQGKLAVTGTMNHADSRLCGMLAQLDISSGTYTAGQISALWVDAGATSVSGALGGQFNMLRISNTTQSVPNSVIYVYSEGSYLLDLGGPSGNAAWFSSGGSDCTASSTTDPLGTVKVNFNGTPGYIRVWAAP